MYIVENIQIVSVHVTDSPSLFVISVFKMYRYLEMVLQSIVYGRLKKYVKYRKKQSQEVSGRKY